MPLNGEEIRRNLAEFAARWEAYQGTERSEAQTFLNELLACYGTDRKAVGARFEHRAGGGFLDMIWRGVCVIEMKRPSEAERLDTHRKQAFDYWTQIQRETGDAGRFVVVCAQWIVENDGVIVDAVSKQPWSGEAVVNVSIVNWINKPTTPPSRFVLDGDEVSGITPSLRTAGLDVSGARRLSPNRGAAFQGPMAVGRGFVLSLSEAGDLLRRTDADYREVVRPFLVGEDIAEDPRQNARRFVIDFGVRPLEEAAHHPAALEIVRVHVKPERELNPDRFRRDHWWLLGRPVLSMREALGPLARYIAGTRVGKRILFCWCAPWTLASDATNAFAFEDDFAMGILCSRIHHEWARAQSSTLRVDVRYTPTTAFETFPWPQPRPEQREEIAELSRQLIARRREICLERQIGLTKLYNEVDEGAYRDLRDLHVKLDEAVAVAYGWPRSAAHDPAESNRRLLELNQEIAEGRVEYDPF